jgi:hypothetical protein
MLKAKLVMPGLVPGIHVLGHIRKKDVDGRDKPGHDELCGGVPFHWFESTPGRLFPSNVISFTSARGAA